MQVAEARKTMPMHSAGELYSKSTCFHTEEVDHKHETQVIKAILELHRSGLSLRQICKTLTSLDISTKIKGKAWHPEMVNRILKNK